MALLTPACLALVVIFVPLYQLNHTFHLFHKLLFHRLLFYQPPSDSTIRSHLPPIVTGGESLSTKERKRLAKRIHHHSTPDHVDLPIHAITAHIFEPHERFIQLQGFIGLNLLVCALVFIEQSWICAKTQNNVDQDGNILPVQWFATVTSPTVTLVAMVIVYDLYIGMRVLASAQNAAVGDAPNTGRHWYRITAAIGAIAFIGSFLLQAIVGRVDSTTTTYFGVNATQYSEYVNQLAFNAWDGLYNLFQQHADANMGGAPIDWFPRPIAGEVHFDQTFSFVMFRLLLSMICACITVGCFCSAWRYSKLLVERLDDNAYTSSDDSFMTRVRMYGNSAWHILNFLTPLFVMTLWIPYLSFNIWMSVFSSSEDEPDRTFAAWRQFELFRMCVVILALVSRFALLREYLQTFLISALSLIRVLPRGGTIDQHVALRIQTLLVGVFWYTPLAALQYLYPLVLSMVLVCALKLSDEWLPRGLSSNTLFANVGGMGVCYGLFGRGVSPFEMTPQLRSLQQRFEEERQKESLLVPTTPDKLFDADEFDGDLNAIELDEPTRIVRAITFSPLSSGNVLSGSIGFLLWWCHFGWFLQTILCVGYLRFTRSKAITKNRAITRVETENITATNNPQQNEMKRRN